MSELNISQFPGDVPHTDLSDVEVVVRFSRNDRGRDFVVGDIHGMFDHLSKLLEKIGFDEGSDRLFSVGDLIDRGPASAAAFDWLEMPWFHACRGNHEQFAVDSEDPAQFELWVGYNGGEWWLDLGYENQKRYRDVLAKLPMAMEVETRSGKVGIVHADVPPDIDWEEFTALLESNDQDALFFAMWSRNRLVDCDTSIVGGSVDRVYCGHTPTRSTVSLGNVYFIDTGAVYSFEGYEDARLTVVEVHPERHREYAISTGERP